MGKYKLKLDYILSSFHLLKFYDIFYLSFHRQYVLFSKRNLIKNFFFFSEPFEAFFY